MSDNPSDPGAKDNGIIPNFDNRHDSLDDLPISEVLKSQLGSAQFPCLLFVPLPAPYPITVPYFL